MWIDDQQRLMEMASTFYSSLFTSDSQTTGEFLNGRFFIIPNDKVEILNAVAQLMKYGRRPRT